MLKQILLMGRRLRTPFFFGNYILNFFLLFLLHCHLECLSVCGQYRPNRAPNPESAVGSRVRPRPLAAPSGLSLRLRAT